MLQAIINFFKSLFKKSEKKENLNASNRIKIAFVVGHSKEDKGAVSASGESEFDYWKKFAEDFIFMFSDNEIFEFKMFLRKSKKLSAITEAYNEAEKWGADAIIELHFNAYNQQVEGSETLCSFDKQDVLFATNIHQSICGALGRSGLSRGVKRKTKSDRGGRSTSSYSGPNCLIEPFFGDNITDLRNFELRILQVRDAIVRGLREYFNV